MFSGVPWVNPMGGGGGAPSGKVCVSIGVDFSSRLGDDRCPMRGSEATERGEGVGGGIPR